MEIWGPRRRNGKREGMVSEWFGGAEGRKRIQCVSSEKIRELQGEKDLDLSLLGFLSFPVILDKITPF